MKNKTNKLISNVTLYGLLTGISIILLLPFLWMVSTSLKVRAETFIFPPIWIPAVPQFSNYINAFTIVPFGRYILNTVVLEIFIIIGQVISCTLVSYGFSRFRFRWRNFLFLLMLSTMLIPQQVTMIPLFLLFSQLGWVDTYLPLIIPTFFGNPFYIFLMRQFMLTIPMELDEAAKIDGANSLQVLWRILVPILRPSITIIVVYTFSSVYNDFLNPLIYINTPDKFTVAIGLSNFISTRGSEWNMFMAVSTIVILPMLIMYYFAQRNLIGGIASMGIKG